MSQALFTRLAAEVKFLRLYTCVRCGAQEQGETERMSVDQRFVSGLHINASDIRPNPTHMPVGWASYTEGIRCPRCKG